MVGSLILGFFDGVHRAHRQILNTALKNSQNEKTVLLTFTDAPSLYFNKNTEYIMKREDSVSIIKALGIDDVILYNFSEIADMPADVFLEKINKEYCPRGIFTGFNYTYGSNKTGTTVTLKENQDKYGYEYFCTPPVKNNNEVISSTLIRQLIRDGNLERASVLLENKFFVRGNVIKGNQLGRTIGFPTANIKYPVEVVKLPYGVYSVNVYMDYSSAPYKGIANWGIKPTINNISEPVLESHILNFSGNLYNKNIKVEFLKLIRKERKFSNVNELKNQISKDIEQC